VSNQFWTWLVVATAILVAAFLRPHGTRIFLGLFFIAMGLGVNLVLLVANPGSFVALGSHSFVPFYRWVFENLVTQYPALMIGPVIVFEVAVGFLILSRGTAARVGLIAAIAFLLAVTPLNAECLPNPILALALAVLFRRPWETGVWEAVREWRKGRTE